MADPTRESLDEAATLGGFRDWDHAKSFYGSHNSSVKAHALTLDQLHNRKHPASPVSQEE